VKVVRLEQFGAAAAALQVVDVASPPLAADEVLVKVEAAGINYFEVLMRRNLYAVTPELPMILGVEAAGVVTRAGAGAPIEVGTRVAVPLFAAGHAGGYAEFVAAPAAYAFPVPDSVNSETAVALLVQGLSARHAVRRTDPKGRSALVTAAAGGLGLLLVQMLKRAGARTVVAAASSADKLKLAGEAGADVLVDYGDPAWPATTRDAVGGTGVDIVYDFVGGALTEACLATLAPEGTLMCGALGRFALDRPQLEAMAGRNQRLHGFALLPLLTRENLAADLAALFADAASGRLRPVIGGRFPLVQTAAAHQRIESRHAVGKIVLVPDIAA
jgi:NADPH:quinone reductase